MANYYFLAPSLPPLHLEEKPEISFEELRARLEVNLTPSDWEQAKVFGLFIDLSNIRSLLLEESIDPRGNLNEKELDEAVLFQIGLPAYVFDFLNRFSSIQDKVRYFWGLYSLFFSKEAEKAEGFLRDYLIFEKEWRLVATALRAWHLKRDIVSELQFEDPSDPLVAHILAQKDLPDYEPPAEYQELKLLLLSCGSDPWQKNQVLARWRFNKIATLVQDPLFSIDWILAYIAQFLIVDQLHELDEKKGRQILDTYKVKYEK
jgi:hypothetical protein